VEIVADHERMAEFLLHPLTQGFLSSISDGVLVIDASDRRIVAMNDKARELLEYTEDEVLGCQCKDMMASPVCTLACPLTAALEGRSNGAGHDLYYRGRGKDKLLYAHTRMILVRDPSGQPVAGIEIFKDLGEVRRLERRLGERTSLRGLVGSSPACSPSSTPSSRWHLTISGHHFWRYRRRQRVGSLGDSLPFSAC
jgi:transcriptional regulator with PAS, ATPase and Fis domain